MGETQSIPRSLPPRPPHQLKLPKFIPKVERDLRTHASYQHVLDRHVLDGGYNEAFRVMVIDAGGDPRRQPALEVEFNTLAGRMMDLPHILVIIGLAMPPQRLNAIDLPFQDLQYYPEAGMAVACQLAGTRILACERKHSEFYEVSFEGTLSKVVLLVHTTRVTLDQEDVWETAAQYCLDGLPRSTKYCYVVGPMCTNRLHKQTDTLMADHLARGGLTLPMVLPDCDPQRHPGPSAMYGLSTRPIPERVWDLCVLGFSTEIPIADYSDNRAVWFPGHRNCGVMGRFVWKQKHMSVPTYAGWRLTPFVKGDEPWATPNFIMWITRILSYESNEVMMADQSLGLVDMSAKIAVDLRRIRARSKGL